MVLDVNQLTEDIKSSVSILLNKDVTTVRGFSNRQLTGIASQSGLIASGIVTGQITPATRDFFLEQLVELSHNFVKTLVGLLITTIERLWNAIVTILWKAISTATGITISPFNPS